MHTSIALALSGGSQPQLPGFLNSLASPLNHYGLWAVLFLVLVEDFGIPVPGETVLIAAAVFAGSGRLNVFAVALVGFVAAVIGDNIGYAIGRFGGRRLVERWGRYVFLTPERLERTESFFNRHGARIIVIARFVEGLRQANGIIAGITGMHWVRFLACNALGAALWVGTWVSIGYYAGQHLTAIYNAITRYTLYAAIVAVIVIVAWVGWRVRRRRRERAESAGEAAGAGGVGGVGGAGGSGGAGDAGGGDGASPVNGELGVGIGRTGAGDRGAGGEAEADAGGKADAGGVNEADG